MPVEPSEEITTRACSNMHISFSLRLHQCTRLATKLGCTPDSRGELFTLHYEEKKKINLISVAVPWFDAPNIEVEVLFFNRNR